jgi:hypothetical protein
MLHNEARTRTVPSAPRPVIDDVGPARKQKRPMTQQYPAAPQAPAGYSAPMEDPGKTLGIVGFVLAFLVSVAGIVVSAIARKKSKEAGFDNQLAKWGLILSIVFTSLWTLYWVVIIIIAIAAASSGELSTY